MQGKIRQLDYAVTVPNPNHGRAVFQEKISAALCRLSGHTVSTKSNSQHDAENIFTYQEKGLSKSKNHALKKATGDILKNIWLVPCGHHQCTQCNRWLLF